MTTPEPTDHDVDAHDPPPAPSSPGSSGLGGFALVVVAVLLLVAGGVYVIGSANRAERDTRAAEASAQEQIELYDPEEFTSELADDDPSPGSIPLADDSPTTTTTVPSSTTTEGPPTDGRHPVVAVDPTRIAVAFISRIPGEGYGRVGWIDVDGERHETLLECSRLDLNPSRGLCLAEDTGLGRGQGYITDAALVPNRVFGLTAPSRAAVSPDGEIVAWTGFTFGHSYLDAGGFSTITQVVSIARGIGANLETAFDTYLDDEPFEAVERNYWGVTFVDSDRFYATMGLPDGTTWIVEGRISNARIDVRWEGVTCPEVSPDGSTVVAKVPGADGHQQLVAIDAATGEQRILPEDRSVEDQVEFLDDDTILYALPNPDEGTEAQPAWDVWVLDLEPGSTPRLLIPFADSPAA